MKKIKSLFFIVALSIIYLTSCKKDDNTSLSEAEITANAQNETENTKIPVVSLASGVSIQNATEVSGSAPTPNNKVNLNLNTSLTEAFQETGFKIEFSSENDVAGAYIQFKDTDGNTPDTYFDVPASSFNYVNKSDKSSRKSILSNFEKSKTLQNFTDQIQIDFNSVITPGEFCYDICLYDSENNISQIETVCVTVEAWGGNAEIVGEWVLERVDGIDSLETINCDSGESIMVNYFQEINNDVLFVIKEDGSYYQTVEGEELDLDYDATATSCVAIYETESYVYNQSFIGYWAFNEDNETLTFVDFKFEDLLNPEYNEEYENGLLAIQGVEADIISGQLVLTFETFDGQTAKAYLDRV